ncbi:MAG: radical SAM protein, partial [Chloroflexota bacterium]
VQPDHLPAVRWTDGRNEHSFDLKRLMKCRIHQLLPDGRAVPFCAYNTLGYREQVRREQEARSEQR